MPQINFDRLARAIANRSRTLLPVVALSLVVATGRAGAQADEGGGDPSPDPQPVTDARQLLRGLLSIEPSDSFPSGRSGFGSAERGARDPLAMAAYEKVAPAVVMVTDGETGHGTGFFIRSDGWIVTNHHVIEGLPFDPRRGSRVAKIIRGVLDDDGAMSPTDEPLLAEVYRASEVVDLALLRVIDPGGQRFPAVEMAPSPPPPGTTCLAIGHPSVGVMWTLRAGSIAGRGTFPDDQIANGFLSRLVGKRREAAADSFAKADRCKVYLSTCGLNPGDSGGPLVDTQGRLIAVSFAVPLIDTDRGIDLAKFSYHVHLDEVQGFLADRPTEPEVSAPSHLPEADRQSYADLDGDGVVDALVFYRRGADGPVGMLIDLDQDSAAGRGAGGRPGKKYGKDFGVKPSGKPRGPNKAASKKSYSSAPDWDFEYAVTLDSPENRFYDLDNDGELDFAVLGADGSTPVAIERGGEGWVRRPGAAAGPRFGDQEMDRRHAEFETLVRRAR